ncbi:LysM peptidoglycan-binding domain-containing protein [Dactylosporangium sucinum]|uniref:Bacterial transcriptional activator domain-containing protein n=1 Tax=Dactylosporangium sucinum TaxID=1424081 RepID=A0A917WRM7_9ACTN|nr:LysM peptidoglycan-binding domain-containing protein [Dactylosporangium sucinum]GGM23787.1 hypothetical protein GCM10007977_026160 [Dactylosporangium sucinum]
MARTAPPSSRGSQILTGLGALAVVVLIAAVPVLLLWAAGNPLPGLADWVTALVTDPDATLRELWHALTSRDDGYLFVHTLTLVGWVAALLAAYGWATFLLAVVVETVTQIPARRRGRVPRQAAPLPGMRLQQRAAAVLVAAIIGVFAAPALASAGPPAAPQPAVTTLVELATGADAPGLAGSAAATTGQPTAGQPTTYVQHPVQRGEALLDVAERHGVHWQRIAEANYGLAQPDGRTLQAGSTRIYAGWVLRIPVTDATPTMTPVAQTTSTGPLVYEVARGDWLSGVAARFLGDPDRYRDIAAINPQLEARDARFPNHIERGWQIILPGDAQDRGPIAHAQGSVVSASAAETQPAPPASDLDDEPRSNPGQQPSVDTPAPSVSATTAPAPSTSSSPSATPGASATASASPGATSGPTTASVPANPAETSAPGLAGPAGAPSAPGPASTSGDSTDDAIVVGALAGAGLLSALLLTAVFRRRQRQRQHRRPGRRLPHPRGGATERALRVVEAPADIDRLDLALRALAAGLADREVAALPDIAAAWIAGQTVTVVLTNPCPTPPAPWVADGAHWTLPGDAALPAVDEQLAPLPTLVTVGSQPGRHLLLDLERLGSLTISGDGERSLALLRYMASELVCNSWSDDVEVILCGWPADEVELLVALNPDRVQVAGSVSAAAARLRRRIGVVTRALQVSGAPNTFAGRLTDLGEAWAPQLLLVADPDRDDLAALADLREELQATSGCAVAVATRAGTTGQTGATGATVSTDGTLQLGLPYLDVQLAAAGLPVAELEPLAEIMTQARNTVVTDPTPPAAEPEPWAADTDAAGAVLELFHEPAPSVGEPAASPPADPPTAFSASSNGSWGDPSPSAVAPSDPTVAIPAIAAIPDAATLSSRRDVAAAVRQRRRRTDPDLDDDLRAWREGDSSRPRIGVLGPAAVEAPGPAPDQRRLFHAEIIVFLAQRGSRGATGAQLSEALWPDQRVKDASRRVAITRARRWLGDTAAGTPWLPEMGSDRVYRLEPGYLLDWHLFRRLRSRGESHGPAGVKDLRAALELVRGAPLDGADRAYASGARNPYAWLPESDIYPGHLVSAIVDTAHELAELYLDAGDTTGARWAVQRAWLADPHRGDDEPWRDVMRAAHAEGHTAELRNLLAELIRAREAEVPEDLAPDTYAWLRPLLPGLLGASTVAG